MNTIATRVALIRAATPAVLPQLFEMQNGVCDLCGEPIQDLVIAALDHSTPVILFARGPLAINVAISQCNAPANLRAAHAFCNKAKNGLTREEWYARGLDKTVGTPQEWTTEEIESFRERLAKGGRIGGPIA